MNNKVLLLTALAVTSLGFASDWTLDSNVGYNFKIENSLEKEHLKENFKPIIPINIKLAHSPSNIDLKWDFSIANDSLDGLFKENKLSSTEVKMNASYKTPTLVGGLKLYTEANLTAYKKDKIGDFTLRLGPTYTFENGLNLFSNVVYDSNKLVTPKYAGGELGLISKYVDSKLEVGYNFEANKGEQELTEFVPINFKYNLSGKYSETLFTYNPTLNLESELVKKRYKNEGEEIVISVENGSNNSQTVKKGKLISELAVGNKLTVKPIAFTVKLATGLTIVLEDEVLYKTTINSKYAKNNNEEVFAPYSSDVVALVGNDINVTINYSKTLGKVTLNPYLELKSSIQFSPTEHKEATTFKRGDNAYALGPSPVFYRINISPGTNEISSAEKETKSLDVVSNQKFNTGLNVTYAPISNVKFYGTLGLDSNFFILGETHGYNLVGTRFKEFYETTGENHEKTDYETLMNAKDKEEVTKFDTVITKKAVVELGSLTPKVKLGFTFTW